MRLRRFALAAFSVVAIPLAIAAQAPADSGPAADVQLQLGDLLFADGRYAESRDAYRRATTAPDAAVAGRAAAGVVMAQLRVGDFRAALVDADALLRRPPDDALLNAVHGDALWAAGMFQEAEAAYETCLGLDPLQARGHHGRARSLAAKNQMTAAIAEAQDAVRLDPREGEFHNTVGSIYQRMHRFGEAAAAFGNYVNLLPDRDRARPRAVGAGIDPLPQSFDNHPPLDFGAQPEDRVWTLPVRLLGDKVFVRAKVNGVGAGVRARHRRRADRHLARAGAAQRRRADHLHRERGRGRRRVSAGCRSAASTRSRSGPEGAQRAGADQEPAAGRDPRPRARELLAAGPRPVDAASTTASGS